MSFWGGAFRFTFFKKLVWDTNWAGSAYTENTDAPAFDNLSSDVDFLSQQRLLPVNISSRYYLAGDSLAGPELPEFQLRSQISICGPQLPLYGDVLHRQRSGKLHRRYGLQFAERQAPVLVGSMVCNAPTCANTRPSPTSEPSGVRRCN